MATSLWQRRALYLLRPKLFWACVALIVMSLAVLATTREPCIRWWGLVLQFLGVISVLRELRGAQQQFGKPGLRELARQWKAGWPTNEPVILSVGGVAASTSVGSVKATVRAAMKPDAPLEERLVAVERNLQYIDQDVRQVERELREESHTRAEADRAETSARTSADESLGRQLAEAAAGSVHFSMFGLVWLAVGMVLSTIAPELAKWLK